MRTSRVLGPLVLAVSVLVAGVGVAHAKPDPKQAKINVYVDILNNWSSYVYKQRSDYAGWVDLAKGPDCKASKARSSRWFSVISSGRFSRRWAMSSHLVAPFTTRNRLSGQRETIKSSRIPPSSSSSSE